MKVFIVTVFVILGLVNNEVLSYLVVAPLLLVGAVAFLKAAAKGGAFD